MPAIHAAICDTVRAATRVTVIAIVFATLVATGCAVRPPPLPPVTQDELPDAWLAPLRELPCPRPFRTRVQVRVEGDLGGANLDGTLEAALPDTLRLHGRVGIFRPVFSLLAAADSAGILLHGESGYWIAAREDIDWDPMNPPAWARALHWAICPWDLLRRFEPEDGGRIEGRLWRVGGRVLGTPYRLDAGIHPRSRTLEEMRLNWEGREILFARLTGYRSFGDAWMPTSLELRMPDGFLLRAELLRVQAVSGGDIGPVAMLRPPGWRPVEIHLMPAIESAPAGRGP